MGISGTVGQLTSATVRFNLAIVRGQCRLKRIRYGGTTNVEEYEVDLRDYVLVLWRWKWLVVGAVLVALVASLGATLGVPTTYQANMDLAQTSIRRLQLPPDFSMPSFETVKRWAMNPPLLAAVTDGTPADARWLERNLELSIQQDFLSASLRGGDDPELQENLLERLTAELNRELKGDLLNAVAARFAELDREERRLTERLTELDDALHTVREEAVKQREKLLQEIEAAEAQAAGRQPRFGEEMNLEGYMAERQLGALFARLEPIERKLDEIERLGVAYIAEREVQSIRDDLKDIDEERRLLLAVEEDPPDLLTQVMGPSGTARANRPTLRMNLAVAGVLGLFVGVLLAFFTEAMTKKREEA